MTPVELVSQLVRIPSENTGPEHRGPCEAGVAEFIGNYLTDHGLSVRRQEALPGRCNLITTIAGGNAKTLWLDAHMDTVQAGRMDIEPFSGEVRDGRIYGRGACDDKAILGAMLHAVGQLSKNHDAGPTVIFTASVDEESGLRGMQKLAEEGLGADAAIIGEPTGLQVVLASKGTANFRVRLRGKAAHTCHPERGVNAIYHAADIIHAIRDRLWPELQQRRHPLLGSPKVSVSIIHGGHRANIVPDECVLEVNRRLLPGETWGEVVAEMQQLIARVEKEEPELQAEVEQPYAYFVGTETPAHDALPMLLREAVRQAGGPADFGGVEFTSHASILAPLGVPCVLFGPGSIDQAHAAVEFVSMDELERSAQILLNVCRRFGN